jgi:hypothetical protein
MIEITNKQHHPVQVIIRSRKSPRAFNTLNIPGLGSGNNTYLLEDERYTDYIDRVEKLGWISVRKIINKTK